MSRLVPPPGQRIRQRYTWLQETRRLRNVSLACQGLGISRKTIYKWRQRLDRARGDRQAIQDRSWRPHQFRHRVGKALRRLLLALRQQTQLGPARLRALLFVQGARAVPSAGRLAKLLRQGGVTRQYSRRPKRYRRVFVVPRPGALVLLDVKYGPYLVAGQQLYQQTAIDCCTWLRLVQFSEEVTVSTAKAFALPGEPDRTRT